MRRHREESEELSLDSSVISAGATMPKRKGEGPPSAHLRVALLLHRLPLFSSFSILPFFVVLLLCLRLGPEAEALRLVPVPICD